jgi:hypothetical protein
MGRDSPLFSGYAILTDSLKTELKVFINNYLLPDDMRRMIDISATLLISI